MLLYRKIKNLLGKFPPNRKLNELIAEHGKMRLELEEIKLIAGKTMAERVREHGEFARITDAEFKVFSQWGDDGIIQYLVHALDIQQKTFVEFGVENYVESNTRFLLMNNNWSGFVMDSNPANIEVIKSSVWFWKYDLTTKAAFITVKNVNSLIAEAGFSDGIGLLSIDIDGNDYWILNALESKPAIIVIEYNALFGNDRTVTVPYDESFYREKAHYSHLYFGASLPAIKLAATRKGYTFAGCDLAGVNAYFLRNDVAKKLTRLPKGNEGFVQVKFRQSRGKDDRLDFLPLQKQIELLRGMPVINVATGQTEKF